MKYLTLSHIKAVYNFPRHIKIKTTQLSICVCVFARWHYTSLAQNTNRYSISVFTDAHCHAMRNNRPYNDIVLVFTVLLYTLHHHYNHIIIMLLQLATVVCLIQIHLMVHHSISASSMTTMETDQLDINDILNANLMPARFLMLDNSDTNAAVTAANRSADTAEECVTPSSLMMMETGKPLDGTFTAALSTMGFHRRMIEKYLCSNYLAERILHKVAPSHFRRRVGVLAPNFGIKKNVVINL